MKLAVIISNNSHDNYVYGVVVIERKYVTCYDVYDAVRDWVGTHLSGTDIVVDGAKREVHYTGGGAAPYRGTLRFATTETVEMRQGE